MSAYTAYQEAEVLSSSPEQLILLLYRRLLVHLREAASCISSGDVAGKSTHVQKGSAILYELAASLDHEVGGELADQLGALYAFFVRELTGASLHRDRARVDRVIEMVSQLNASWIAAAAELGQTTASAV